MQQGTRLGRYEILSALGRGGMGEVWRARDTKLDRDIAIKMLPAPFARDEQRLTRFQREARLLAALSHPNIAALYDLEHAGETTFLALELVEGETLAERLIRGPIPVSDALTLALQIAEALEAAHERGVMHRDLKPANIKVTPNGKIKVLDFGLAKAFDVSGRDGASSSPALTVTGTAHGTILGTPAYMAPEQARGESVDARADVWAFGCVLFEMLTGEGAFGGETTTDVLASVLKVEPGWERLPAKLHPRVRHVLERCLEKSRRNRFAGISDARVEIEKALADPRGLLVEAAAASQQAPPGRRGRFAAAVLGGVLLSGLVAGFSVWQLKPSPPTQVMHFVDELPLGPPVSMLSWPEIDVSRDGMQIAYMAGESMISGQQLYVRAIEDARPRAVQGVAGLQAQPRFSPDGRWLAYFSPPNLVKVPVDGGTPQVLVGGFVEAIRGFRWTDEHLVYAARDGIFEVPATGGDPRVLVRARDGEFFASPQRLPGRDAVLFSVAAGPNPEDWDAGGIVVQSLVSGERTVVAPKARDARYLPGGQIVYAQGAVLWAAPFDLDRLEVTGTPVRVVEDIVRADEGLADSAQYAVSDTGSLVYLETAPGALSAAVKRRSLVWVDGTTGARQPIDTEAGDYSSARISPDGRQVALVVGQTSAGRPPDLRILDLETGTRRQLTSGKSADAPVWFHDSTLLYFRSHPTGSTSIYSVSANGGEPELIAPPSVDFPTPFPWALTPDGRTMLIVDTTDPAGSSIATLGLGAEREFGLLLRGARFPAPSPNGAWMAYVDTSGGTPKISITTYPDVGRQTYPVAIGNHPLFSPKGNELYFVEGDALRAVSVDYEPIRIGTPRDVFRGPYTFTAQGRAWDVHPDGKRFLMLLDEDTGAPASPLSQRIHIVVNWTQELRRRLAAE